MDDLNTIPPHIEDDEDTATPKSAPAPAAPSEEKKPEGIEHDPYEWHKCAIMANIVWLPDGSIMLGARNHLDAPIITVLSGEALTTLPGHAAELPIPTVETIADLLAQLREDLPLRAKAKMDRDEATRKQAEEARHKQTTGKKNIKPVSTQTATPAATSAPSPAKLPPVGKAPAATQVSLFNFMTGGN